MSTSPYMTAVTGNPAAKVYNGCGLNAHNQEHHNKDNCQRRTHPEIGNEERVAYANSTAGRPATTRRQVAGLPDLPHIDKTYLAPINNLPAAGNEGGGCRGGRGRDGPGNRGTTGCTPCLITLIQLPCL